MLTTNQVFDSSAELLRLGGEAHTLIYCAVVSAVSLSLLCRCLCCAVIM